MVEVTEVEKKRSRWRIILESGEKYMLSGALYRERPLRPGDSVDPEEFSHWVLLRQYRPALERAVAMLALRACSRGEIQQRLIRAGYTADTVEMVIYKLEKEGLLNDRDFASQWVSHRSSQKYGPRRIARELRMKGISGDDAEAAMEEVDETENLERAILLAKKGFARAKAGEDVRKTRQRVLSALVRRGYDWETARQACAAAHLPEEEE